MSNVLILGSDYDGTPAAYKNFYERVVEPAMFDGDRFLNVRANDLLKEYNAHWDLSTHSIKFNTDRDLTMFMLRWA